MRRITMPSAVIYHRRFSVTSLACWIGVDSRGPASLYIAADSRVSWPDGRVQDQRVKTVASPTTADIVAFCGSVDVPNEVLNRIQQASLFDPGPAEQRHRALVRVAAEIASTRGSVGEFCLLHGAREGEGGRSQFRLWRLEWDLTDGWSDIEETLPPHSELAISLGSGQRIVRDHDNRWRKSEVGRTSRAVFSAFCESLRSGCDPWTGGAPQLVGLFRKGTAETFGVVWSGVRHLRGLRTWAPGAHRRLEWRNELFERCDPGSGHVLQGAQRHARPRNLGTV